MAGQYLANANRCRCVEIPTVAGLRRGPLRRVACCKAANPLTTPFLPLQRGRAKVRTVDHIPV